MHMPDELPTPVETKTAAEPDLSGRKLGDYQLLRRLGRGGMAEVYLAEQASLRRQVAFKVLKNSLANDKTYVRRFHNEAQAAAALVQANIVQIYEVGCIDGVHFIAQEYVSGLNLKQLLTRHGPLDAKLAVNVMRQVAAALHKAGQQGIIHRDIKPENIMLASNGEVKVADFGLARVTGNGDKLDLTQVGITMGTPLYMSPEQVEGRTIDPRSDIYSFGVTCYQVLAGRTPFEGETALSVAVQHLKTAPQRLEEQRPDLPGGLCRIVHKMLAKSPTDRYQNSAELLRDLRSLPIAGLDEEWSSGMDEWSSSEMLALDDARLAATKQLDAVMKTEAVKIYRRDRTRLWVVAAVAAAFILGAALAWAWRPESLLAINPADLPAIEKMESARLQYFHASFLNTEQAWNSVEQYFPPALDSQNKYYSRLANERLAELYLRDDDLDRALSIFDELASLEETETQFRTFGMAGQVIVYHRQGERKKVTDLLPRVIAQRRLLEPEMRATIEGIARDYLPADAPPQPSPQPPSPPSPSPQPPAPDEQSP
jgi:tRNA A-37 threonylcarbamoyl transferase component Bud32